MYDLPPDLPRLRTLEHQVTIWLGHIRRAIAAAEQRQAEQQRGKERRPAVPDWIVELGIGQGAPPMEVHAGSCHAGGRRRRTIDRDEARRLLAEGLRSCTHCNPDRELRILD
ncbi:hypothetical protein K388_07485 [Streptomyces sp. KhCrAH-43]|uniref:DUF6233 domain-containing protein n=1 Tax=unclassified Streptomyces TaxID=2593676 RepID=UPI00036A9D3F|nr:MULTISPECIES: DUF6233 domain-containing protein [unclassified Streptomyces]MYS37167.1 hypothetical protein [Streptomyces sp. SID4920]MYX67182.1 hypothetical protein [Streptomyces sp. SID8373]RAJ42579.1 hypothetical protein K388_07485 [Streptomyces sp. KhCrAH-43]